MAKVEMDLNELKAIEKKIETLELEKQELIDNQKMVVNLHKYFKPRLVVAKNMMDVYIHGVRLTKKFDTNRYGSGIISKYENFERNDDLEKLIREGIINIEFTETGESSRDYINLDDVKKSISEDVYKEFEAQVTSLMEKNSKLTISLQDAVLDSKKEIQRLKKDYDEKIETLLEAQKDLQKQHVKEIEGLNETKDELVKAMTTAFDSEKSQLILKYEELKRNYDDLKEDKKRVSLENQIASLNKELERLKNRGFWKRLFND